MSQYEYVLRFSRSTLGSEARMGRGVYSLEQMLVYLLQQNFHFLTKLSGHLQKMQDREYIKNFRNFTTTQGLLHQPILYATLTILLNFTSGNTKTKTGRIFYKVVSLNFYYEKWFTDMATSSNTSYYNYNSMHFMHTRLLVHKMP